MHALMFLLQTVVTQQPAAPSGGSPLGGMLPMLALMVLVIYFVLIRPANKQRKQHEKMLNELRKDDEVVTSGGIFGRVVSIEDRVAVIEIADKVKIRVQRERIAGKVPEPKPAASK